MAEVDWAGILEKTLDDSVIDILPPTLQLPALPQAVALFVQKTGDPDASLQELASILETDSGLTTEILKYINSSFMGLRSTVGTVQQALSLLGQRQAKMHIVTTATQAAVRAKKSKLINQKTFWNSSFQKALFAKELAGLLKADRELAFSGALLQDFLLPVISNELFDDYLNFITNRDDFPDTLCEFERSQFGWDHSVAGACLAKRWHLPDELACCILFHHSGLKILGHSALSRSAVAAVALSALLPDELQQESDGLTQLIQLGAKWNAFDFEKVAAAVDEQQEALGLGVRNSFPLLRRVQAAMAVQAE